MNEADEEAKDQRRLNPAQSTVAHDGSAASHDAKAEAPKKH